MDDMKKLIERYKKELMDMSRSRPAPAPEPQPEKKRTPQVIGYVDEGAQLDEIFSRLAENPPKAVSTEQVPEEQVPVEKAAAEQVPEEIFGGDKQTEEMNEEVVEQPKTPVAEERDNRVPEVNEPENPSAIADGYPTRQTAVTDEDITDSPRFTEPRFTEIPSFEQTREDITNESMPENNAPAPNASGVTDNSPTTPRADFAYGGTVSEERAEGLNRQPISGTEYGEQLTGRSFPDERTPENSRSDIVREGSQTEPGNFPEPVYADFAEFERKNTGKGTMAFRVYTAREALPVIGAKVIITKQIGGEMHTFSVLTTDMSGQTAPITLPAPEKNLSLDSGNKIQPFSLYDAIVTKNGYAAIRYTGIPVFDGVNSVQRAAMVPTEEKMTENITEVSENA
ncbi:MAG: hypothetical protein ACI4JZ_01400 [Oscillospiraceae bacterium]